MSTPFRFEMTVSSFVCAVRAALRAASDDLTRPHLSAVDVRVTAPKTEAPHALGRVRIAATDGHWAFIHETDEEVVGEGAMLLSRATCEDIARAFKGWDIGTVVVERKADAETATLVCGPHRMTLAMVDATFPPLDVVLPKTRAPLDVITFDATFLTEIAKAFGELRVGRRKEKVAMTFAFTDRMGPTTIVCPTFKAVRAVLMPMNVGPVTNVPPLETSNEEAVAAE